MTTMLYKVARVNQGRCGGCGQEIIPGQRYCPGPNRRSNRVTGPAKNVHYGPCQGKV